MCLQGFKCVGGKRTSREGGVEERMLVLLLKMSQFHWISQASIG